MIKIIVDSTFGLTQEYVDKHDLHVVDLIMLLDGKEYSEGFEENWNRFYNDYEKSKDFPKTSQPNPSRFEEAIKNIYSKEPEAEIIILTIGSGLSGTVNSANVARNNFPDRKIALIDSYNASIAEFVYLDEVIKYVEAEHDFLDTVHYAEELRKKTGVYFIPASMGNLYRSGRISKITSIIGSILVIKPIFEFKNNIVTVVKKAIGIANAINEMIKKLPANIKRLVIGYINDDKYVSTLKEALEKQTNVIDIIIKPVSTTFGVHVGLGAFGVAYVEA
ncbi:MAG: DegV family protein [Bacillales bacterium]|jgi:DegV family protein with EDD domain|nr:DegV family protein [Bacillales bacterium]